MLARNITSYNTIYLYITLLYTVCHTRSPFFTLNYISMLILLPLRLFTYASYALNFVRIVRNDSRRNRLEYQLMLYRQKCDS